MPDLIFIFSKRWKFILGFTLMAVIIALIASLLSSKKYLSTATALPANSLLADKARIGNQNIEALYSELGLPDELDKLEGTATLDTIYIATAAKFNLAGHYNIRSSEEASSKAVLKLRKNSHIARSGYGELKIKVWDEDRQMAADIANNLMHEMQQLHQNLQMQNAKLALQKIKDQVKQKQDQFHFNSQNDTIASDPSMTKLEQQLSIDELKHYKQLIAEYEMALAANPQALLIVEPARASVWADKPKTLQIVLLTLAASFATTLLMAVSFEKRKVL